MKKKKKKLKKKFERPKPKRFREVQYSSAEMFMSWIDSRRDGVYDKMAVYMLMLSIRDLIYRGNNKYACYARHKAINWFNSRNDRHPFGYGTVCLYLNINPKRLWLQLRRWMKVNHDYLSSILKSAESGIFDGTRSSNLKKGEI